MPLRLAQGTSFYSCSQRHVASTVWHIFLNFLYNSSILFSPNLKLVKTNMKSARFPPLLTSSTKLFESLITVINSENQRLTFINVYRLPLLLSTFCPKIIITVWNPCFFFWTYRNRRLKNICSCSGLCLANIHGSPLWLRSRAARWCLLPKQWFQLNKTRFYCYK